MILCAYFKPVNHLHLNPRTAQPAQLSVGDAAQDQSKAGAAVPASGAATNTPTQPAWNPFDDDNFSNLTADEFKSEDKKPAGKVCVHMFGFSILTCDKGLITRDFSLAADVPSELEPSSSEELIPGLQASTGDNVPQETGTSPFLFRMTVFLMCFLLHEP